MGIFLKCSIPSQVVNIDSFTSNNIKSFPDFLAFKEMFVDYAVMKRSGGLDLSDLLSVSSIPID